MVEVVVGTGEAEVLTSVDWMANVDMSLLAWTGLGGPR